jgi:hypothetical protein
VTAYCLGFGKQATYSGHKENQHQLARFSIDQANLVMLSFSVELRDLVMTHMWWMLC